MFVLPLLFCSQAAALVTGGARAPAGSSLTRRQALGAAAVLPFAPAACQADAPPASTKSGVGITVIKTGTGGTPTKGDLCAIRFKGSVKATGQVFDDIMASAEPYYFRVGNEKVLPGVEEAVKMMRTGDVWELAVPGKLGFGEKGRSASPGKPRIPNNADLIFVVELSAVPGKDEEIIDILEAEAEEAAAAKAALGAKVAPKQPED
jgi:peptidylprolyl isomerase